MTGTGEVFFFIFNWVLFLGNEKHRYRHFLKMTRLRGVHNEIYNNSIWHLLTNNI